MEILRSALFVPLVAVCGALLIVTIDWFRSRAQLKRIHAELAALEADRQQLENQLNQARRMEAVGILAGSIVNNLNNLLAVIIGHTRLATQGERLDPTTRGELERVLKAGRMASDLVQEISDFYRQADQARKPTNLGPVVRDTVKLLRDIFPATVSISADLRPCGPVLATTTGIQQVLMNLCSNALNAMHRRQGTLEIALAEEKVEGWHKAIPRELGPGSYVRLSVRDNGSGMDADTFDHIFDSYFSGGGNGKKMGIGLSTVYRILDDHDGATIAHSEVGQGTTFDIFFPLIAWSVTTGSPEGQVREQVDGTKRPALLSAVAQLEPEIAEAAAADAPRATVMLVDDEEMVSQVLTRGLQRHGFRVIAHTDSRKALADFSQTPDLFDVVVTDQIMPHMSGVRLTRKIRNLRPDLPVILFTGFRDSFNEAQAREAGVSDFILKPSSHRDLADLIERVVPRRQAGRG